MITDQRSKEILLATVRFMIEEKKPRIVGQNEFHRELVAMSQKLEMTLEEVRELSIPFLRERFEAMIAPMSEKERKPGIPVSGGPFSDAPPQE